VKEDEEIESFLDMISEINPEARYPTDMKGAITG